MVPARGSAGENAGYHGVVNAFLALIERHDPTAARAETIETLMVNVGRTCNMRCSHCHQDAGPERTESMSAAVASRCIEIARALGPRVVDITGGAPELHAVTPRLVTELAEAGVRVRLRTNLTALLDPRAEGFAQLLASLGTELLASLPSPDAGLTDGQRGEGAHERSIEALRMLNSLGYGNGALRLDLAVNPVSATLPESAGAVRRQFSCGLAQLGIAFNDLIVLTNVPIGRMGQTLRAEGGLGDYLDVLERSFNEANVPRLACRSGIEIAWDGTFADCDFNLGAGLGCNAAVPVDIFELELDPESLSALVSREINYGPHCYSCVAGAGSS